ncbi:E3 ubiquitin-protein ligase Itchy-like [Mya arenaria]|nr:E3 ubiquitin-protein ligase Itchy-like [Mya arenaria]
MKAACRQQFAILGLYKKTLISQLVLKWTGINQVRHVWSAGKTFHYPCYGIMWMAAINWKCLLQEKETEFRHRLQFASLPVQKEMGVCPVCNGSFEVNVLEAHASGCGIDTITAGGSESLMDPQTDFESALNDRFDKMVLEGSWPINVVRRHFNNTAMEELSNGNIKDWGKKLNVKFIGEDGVDSGGLTREFFSLLFETSPVFEDNGFSYNADLLEKKHYQLMGKATSMAILHGHPGPRNLNRTIVDFILENKEPEEIPECCIQNAEVKAAIEEISTATKETIGDVFERHSHLLEASGYKQLLSVSNRDRAIRTMKFYYCFYKYIPPMLQFIEGLKLHDMLLLLTKHGENGRALLCCDTKSTSMSDVLAFFVPKFSKSEHEKADEEMIVYNFGKFLKKVENAISTDWVKMNSSEESLKEVTINLGDVLQALIGCRSLPRNIKSGEMEFDHLSNQLSYVNTCAPSIIFTRTKELVNYEKLEHHLICIIVEAEGFGLA